jgi:hypothetical protein
MPIVDSVPRAYKNETQLSEQKVPIVAAKSRTQSVDVLSDMVPVELYPETNLNRQCASINHCPIPITK